MYRKHTAGTNVHKTGEGRKYGMKILGVVIFVIALAVSSAIVNGAQRLFMRLIGAVTMFFNGKAKLFAIVFIAMVIAAPIMNLFGII